jgi:spore maturation protein CgeB
MKTKDHLKVAFFGSSLVSAYWNGAATYYRGILRALAARGHRIVFFEPNAFDRQKHRDIPDPPWAEVVVYSGQDLAAVEAALEQAADSDLVVKASGVGVFDEFLERSVLRLRRRERRVAFWDVDAPATIERVRQEIGDPFRALIPEYDIVFTYGGGPPVVTAYADLGARRAVPIYNALDPDTHHPVPPDPRFGGDLGFLANRLPDREARVEEFFFRAAERLPDLTFVLGGSGWQSRRLPSNVRYVGHVYTSDHNAFNCSTRAVLNVNRDSMARFGYSPATRVFEAAGAGACLITDSFVGLELFLEPGKEVLVARDGEEVAEHLRALDVDRMRSVGRRAQRRALAAHTYVHRAVEVEKALHALWAADGSDGRDDRPFGNGRDGRAAAGLALR